MSFAWKKLTSAWGVAPAVLATRRPKRMQFSWDSLEDRKVLSHGGGIHHVQAAVAHVASTVSTSTSTTTGSSNSTLSTALKTLHTDVQTILAASGTTIGELTTIHTAFQTLKTDGLTPTSQSALSTFENGLVSAFTKLSAGSTLAGDTALLTQFEALYTSTPTAQQTTDLTAAYDALAAAVTSSGITAANLTTIDTDYAAVLAAESSTSTATYPYFSLVTGGGGFGGGFGGFGGGGFGGHGHGGGSC